MFHFSLLTSCTSCRINLSSLRPAMMVVHKSVRTRKMRAICLRIGRALSHTSAEDRMVRERGSSLRVCILALIELFPGEKGLLEKALARREHPLHVRAQKPRFRDCRFSWMTQAVLLRLLKRAGNQNAAFSPR